MQKETLFIKGLIMSSIILGVVCVLGGCGTDNATSRAQPVTENKEIQSDQPLEIKPAKQAIKRDAEMSLVIDKYSLKEGDEFEVGIELKNDQMIDGVDVILDYDSKLLQILDERVNKGDILDTLIFEDIDQDRGEVKFSVISKPGQPRQESGRVALLHFKATRAGRTEIAFDFKKGLTTDTNVASGGNDILGKVKGLELVIEKM